MGRLDCKEPSLIALKGLARDADLFLAITEDEARQGTDTVTRHRLASTPSGAAGIAALLAMDRKTRTAFGLGGKSRVLAILSEEAEA
jgi:diaminopropionate ammonia-lyase